MATITVRQLPQDVHARLRERASRAGRSMEAEVRAILSEVVRGPMLAPKDLQNLVDELYGSERPESVVDELLAERRREARET